MTKGHKLVKKEIKTSGKKSQTCVKKSQTSDKVVKKVVNLLKTS